MTFSPNGKHLAYIARAENKQIVIIDDKEIGQYDGVLALENGGLVFDASDAFHFLAIKDKSIVLVEVKIK